MSRKAPRRALACVSGLALLTVSLGSLAATGCSPESTSPGGNSRIQRLRVLEDRPRELELGYGNWDMATNGEALLARTLIDPGDTVFDVGAHVGAWSLHVLEHHPGVRLYAFEPSPATFVELERNLDGSGGIPVKVALSDSAGMMPFHVHPDASSLDGFYDRVPESVGSSTIEIPTARLDAYCEANEIERIDYLKIDTEGAELLVLRGATGLLENRSIQLLQFEYGGTYPDAGITLREVFELLSSFDYELYRILRNGLLHVDGWRDTLETYRYANYLAVAP